MRTHLVLVAALIGCWECGAAPSAFRAGIAVRNVTPDPLLPVCGGVGASKPATVKQGELTVRALAFENRGIRLVLVSTDFLGFPAVLGNRVRARVHGVPPDHILIGATHTHSAPDPYGFPDEKGQVASDLKYLDSVVAKTAEAINEAVAHLEPASLKTATGEARGRIAYNYYAPDLYDPRVCVIQVLRADGQPLATLVNYAIHPEIIGSGRGICSPDLVGPLCDRVAEKGGGTGFFLNSAQGGMVTADNRRPGGEANDWAECVRIGHLLADEALRVVSPAVAQSDPEIHVAVRTVSFPVESPIMRAIMRGSPLGYRADAEGKASTQVNLVNLGDTQLLTIPGEALPNIGYYLKRKMRGKHNLLLGLTNDSFGYLLTAVDWGSFKRYEYISRTSLGEQAGDLFIAAALRLISEEPAPVAP